TNKVAFVGATNAFIQNTASTTLNKPSGLHTNDVMLAGFAVRGGSGTTITAPDATWNAVTRIDNGTTISIVTFWHAVTNIASEPEQRSVRDERSARRGERHRDRRRDGDIARVRRRRDEDDHAEAAGDRTNLHRHRRREEAEPDLVALDSDGDCREREQHQREQARRRARERRSRHGGRIQPQRNVHSTEQLH